MTDFRVYPDDLHTPIILTADDETPYVVVDHYEDEGVITFHLYRFPDRPLAEIFSSSEHGEREVVDEIGRRKRASAKRGPQLPPDEPVSVIRVLEYRGPRTWVEDTVRRSIHGTRIVETGKSITGATVSDFPRRV